MDFSQVEHSEYRVVTNLMLAAGFCSALMGIGAHAAGIDALGLSSICFSLTYVLIAYAAKWEPAQQYIRPLGLFSVSVHCCFIACGASLSPAPAFVFLPSLVMWLTLYDHRGFLRIVGLVHVGLVMACISLGGDGQYEVPWLSSMVLVFCSIAFLVTSYTASVSMKHYWQSMHALEHGLQTSEVSLQNTAQQLEAQRDELVATSKELQASVQTNAQQIDELRFANEARSQVARAASSDLKQPLRNITSFMQLITRRLERDGLAEEVREYLNFVSDGASRMNGMVDDLLRYSADPDSVELSEVDTAQTLSVISNNLRDLLAREGGSLQVAPSMPVVLGQPTQVLQLFQNLISNGIKFRSPDRAPACRISFDMQEGMVRFGVHDNGIGIPANRLGDVFGLFTRLHERGMYEGTGIGLATCRRIVIAAGGEIWAESVEGEGTSFYFTLPQNQG